MSTPHAQRIRGWITILTAMVSMFLLGAIYAYGVLLPDIMRAFGWESSLATLPQSILLFVYAVGMGIGGIVLDRTNPTRVAIGGGIIFGLGLILASRATGIATLVGAYGIMAGIGFGFAYVAAVTAAMTTLPHRRGLAAGLVVGAFGAGSAVWAPLAQRLLSTLGWSGLLFIFGIITIILLPLLALGIRAPHHGAPGMHKQASGMTLNKALHTSNFWIVFAAYMLVTAAGLLWLNHYKLFGSAQGIPDAQAAWLVVITAVGSATGRVVMGGISDKIGRFPALIGAGIVGAAMFVLLAVGMPHVAIFVIAGVIGLCFGTWLSLYGPTSTDLFGLRAAGAIYGALYLSYGIGGLVGPTLGGRLADFTDSYRAAFLVAAAFCVLGAILFFITSRAQQLVYRHPPAREEEFPV